MALMISSYYDNGGIICWVNKTMLSKTTTFTALSSAYFQNTKTPKHQNTKTPKHQNTKTQQVWRHGYARCGILVHFFVLSIIQFRHHRTSPLIYCFMFISAILMAKPFLFDYSNKY
jgi:hypothetical protein